MPETRETFELLKNYIEEIPVGLLLFDSKKSLLSWNKYAVIALEKSEEDFKKNNFGLLANQISEILESKAIAERELIGLSKPYKVRKILTGDGNTVLIISETYQESIGEM